MIARKNLKTILLSIGFFLMIPLIAMQFTSEVNWTSIDFLIMGMLLLITSLIAEFGWRKIKTMENRVLLIAIIFILFLLIWAELAVGIFGTPFAGN